MRCEITYNLYVYCCGSLYCWRSGLLLSFWIVTYRRQPSGLKTSDQRLVLNVKVKIMDEDDYRTLVLRDDLGMASYLSESDDTDFEEEE